uniref:Uncharacterized protein n=1 Tax=Eutreptiella gymnastica TaxID=73025 RepID=A0A7S4GE25_9EUGL|mmetsp:Transcript_44649/g.72729  ORF Transcript_44649/g.72729 Transcript_44649/m.72729 type:complete len:218 (+) Transcript_44649:248-901(+)
MLYPFPSKFTSFCGSTTGFGEPTGVTHYFCFHNRQILIKEECCRDQCRLWLAVHFVQLHGQLDFVDLGDLLDDIVAVFFALGLPMPVDNIPHRSMVILQPSACMEPSHLLGNSFLHLLLHHMHCAAPAVYKLLMCLPLFACNNAKKISNVSFDLVRLKLANRKKLLGVDDLDPDRFDLLKWWLEPLNFGVGNSWQAMPLLHSFFQSQVVWLRGHPVP